MKQIIILIIGLILFGCASNKDNQLDFIGIFGNNDQTFVINNRNDTVIIGQSGTQIMIPKNLITKSISDKDTIKIVLNEFYSKSDMILAGLSTTSGSKILETKGMINLNIYLNNEKINKLNKSIDIKFAGIKDFNDYSIFNSDFIDYKINWGLDTLTKHYHIYYNVVLKGKPCIPFNSCDYASETTRLDSILWSMSYNKIDSIITFSKSNDTIIYPDFWKSESIDNNPKFKKSFKISKLGWINCDRFIDFTDLTSIKVKSNASSNPYYFLVFDDINSIMPNY